MNSTVPAPVYRTARAAFVAARPISFRKSSERPGAGASVQINEDKYQLKNERNEIPSMIF